MRRLLLALALLLSAATALRAEEAAAPLEGEALFNAKREGGELWLGGGPIAYPRYPGAGRDRVRLIPAITGGWGEHFDFDLLDGARLALIDVGGFTAGPATRVRFGRQASDNRRRLTGFREFGDTAEIGGFLAYEAGPFSAETTLTQDPFRTHRGAVWETRALLSVPAGRVAFSGGPFFRAVTRPYAESYYDVPAGIAGRPAYRAGGGAERAGLTLGAEWRVTDTIALRPYIEMARLLGSAARSPLVRGEGGSRDQIGAGLFVVWRAF